jgi:hypothetical protein
MLSHPHWSSVLLPLVAGLLLEELTFGGLVRLLLAPWPENRTRKLARDSAPDRKTGQ